jgi:TatA/E family protein of Tat protein translocase
MEILLIVVIALIVFGPAKLPEIMGQVGRTINDFRRATSELSDEFNRTIQAELRETRSVVDETKSAVTGVHTSINAAISGTPAPTLTAPAPAPTLTAEAANGAPSGSTATGANGTHVAAQGQETQPALADTAQWSWETAAPATPRPAEPVSAARGEPSAGTDGRASAAGSPTASPSPAPSTSPSAAPPVAAAPSAPERPVAPRKSSRRDDLLPPY